MGSLKDNIFYLRDGSTCTILENPKKGKMLVMGDSGEKFHVPRVDVLTKPPKLALPKRHKLSLPPWQVPPSLLAAAELRYTPHDRCTAHPSCFSMAMLGSALCIGMELKLEAQAWLNRVAATLGVPVYDMACDHTNATFSRYAPDTLLGSPWSDCVCYANVPFRYWKRWVDKSAQSLQCICVLIMKWEHVCAYVLPLGETAQRTLETP